MGKIKRRRNARVRMFFGEKNTNKTSSKVRREGRRNGNVRRNDKVLDWTLFPPIRLDWVLFTLSYRVPSTYLFVAN
jgi:hypothetical protein